MEDELLISVVVPVYNVAPYLDRCVRSIVSQTYRNIEIILVDDGSTDSCPAMCDAWQHRDPRIRVVHQKNAGLGMARNTGIEHAAGDYICFYDSDDYVAQDALEKCTELLKKEHADIIVYGFHRVDQNGSLLHSTIPHSSRNVYVKEEVQDAFLPELLGSSETSGLWVSMWGAVFSMDLIRRANWRVVSEREIISEDVYSLLWLYKYVRKVSVLPEALYYYCVNRSSLTHTYRTDRYEQIKVFYNLSIQCCDTLGYNRQVRNGIAYQYLSFTIAAMKQIVTADLGMAEQFRLLRAIIRDDCLQQVLNSAHYNGESRKRKFFMQTMKRELPGITFILLKLQTL